MKTGTVLMFPGQGSHSPGMGLELVKDFPREFALAGEILGYSLVDGLKSGAAWFERTDQAQVSIYFVNALHALRQAADEAYLMGHSLGELNALQRAGVFDLFTGLRIVRQRGLLMQKASGGAMAAVIGLDAGQIEECIDGFGFDAVHLANINTGEQIVISGEAEQVKEISMVLAARPRVRVVPLKTSGAFHSPLMADAMREFRLALDGFVLEAPGIPVIANHSAREYPSDAEGIKDLLAAQIAGKVLWKDSIAYLLGLGARDFVEINQGSMLGRMVEAVKNSHLVNA